MESQTSPSQCEIRDVDPEKNPFDCLLRYDFTIRGEPHDVQLEHQIGIWRLMVDGGTVLTKYYDTSNPLTPAKHSIHFKVKTSLPDGDQNGLLCGIWVLTPEEARWSYEFSVNGLDVRPSWASEGQAWAKDAAVEVLGDPGMTMVPVADEELAPPATPVQELVAAPDSLALIPDEMAESPSSEYPLLNIATDMSAIMERPPDGGYDGKWSGPLPVGCSCSDVWETQTGGNTEYFVYTCRLSAPMKAPTQARRAKHLPTYVPQRV